MNKLRLLGWLLIGCAIVVAGIAAWLSFETSIFTVVVDGEAHSVRGNYTSLEDVLSEAGVELGPYDTVDPDSLSAIESGGVVTIDRARAITVHTDDGNDVYWTHQERLSPFFEENNITIGPSTDILAGDIRLNIDELEFALLTDEITVSQFKEVEIDDDGTPIDIASLSAGPGHIKRIEKEPAESFPGLKSKLRQ